MAKVLLIANDIIGPTMAGPGIRYVELAKALAKDHQVTIAAPHPSQKIEGLKTFIYLIDRPKSLLPALEKAEVIIAQSLHPVILRAVRRRQIKYIADLYDPIVLENLEAQSNIELADQRVQNSFFLHIMNTQLALADHILCASERQRDYWLGALTALGRLTPDLYRNDSSLNSLISLLPFGYTNDEPKVTNKEALSDLIPHFNPEKDKLLIWGGGIWNWFDPLTLIKAISRLADQRNDIKLLFLGTKHPNPKMPEMKMINEAFALAEKLKVKDSHVWFNTGWVPYDELANYLVPATIGVSTHFNHAETRMSFRTRILSYVWAGLPIVATKGDAMSDLIEKEGLGITVDYQNVDEIVEAITQIVDQPKFTADIKNNLARIWAQFTWEELAAPLSYLISKNEYADQQLSSWQFYRLLLQYYTKGINKIWQKEGLKGLQRKITKRS